MENWLREPPENKSRKLRKSYWETMLPSAAASTPGTGMNEPRRYTTMRRSVYSILVRRSFTFQALMIVLNT